MMIQSRRGSEFHAALLTWVSTETVFSSCPPPASHFRCAKLRPTTATSALRHADIVGNVQPGRGGLRLTTSHPSWRKATAPARRKMVVEEVHRQEEVAGWIRAVSLRTVDAMGECQKEKAELEGCVGYGSLCHQGLPTPTNLHQWVGAHPGGAVCSRPASFWYMLMGCKTSLTLGLHASMDEAYEPKLLNYAATLWLEHGHPPREGWLQRVCGNI